MTDMTLPGLAAATPEVLIDALNGTFGRHPGMRASHAKGLAAAGVFVPSEAAHTFAATEVFAPGRYPAKVRFSIAGGNTGISDKAPAARGMAVEIAGPGESRLTLVMISAPVFFAATPESFVAYLAARRPDPATGKPDPRLIEASNRSHTDSEAQRRWLAATPPSASYATTPYFAVHTYQFATADGAEVPARWIFEPVAGRIGLSAEQLAAMPEHFLAQELEDRFAAGPAEWRVLLSLPDATDPLHNPTALWPETRRTLEVGRFVVDRIATPGSPDDCSAHVFDPEHLPPGIRPAGDPIFSSRSASYAVSAARRA